MTETVLLVEDEHNVGAMVRSYLSHHGYPVVWVKTAEEAWVELGRHPVDRVLLDIRLPGMDGFELCRRVRERPVGSGLGLAIMKDLTEVMGGRVDVESHPGEGTVFTVSLPRSLGSAGAALNGRPDGALRPEVADS